MYFALSKLNLNKTEYETMRFGLLLDLFECWKQEQGIVKPYREIFVDDVIPMID